MRSVSVFPQTLLVLVVLAGLWAAPEVRAQDRPQDRPLRVAVVGLSHGHVDGNQAGLPASLRRDDVEVVGIYEPDEALAARYAERLDLDAGLFYTDLEAMLDATRPEAVTVFTDTFEHLRVVEAAAPRGIDVMVEKPLATTASQAHAIAALAEAGGIDVLVNYETTWYPSNRAVYERMHEDRAFGAIRKMVALTGHEGPEEIGVSQVFLDWLTDPVRNGAGALFDFGCYGANVMTWLMDGRRPLTVSATLQAFKDDADYAGVDDEATIVLTYPEAQGIIQASWNWPYSRKEMDFYGETGTIYAPTPDQIVVATSVRDRQPVEVPALEAPYDDPLSYLKAVVRGEIEPEGRSSLANNVVVTEILDAARRSAQTGRTVTLDDGSGYTTLFDGETLEGWHRHEGLPGDNVGGKWEVVDGAIVGDQDPPGVGGFLVTDDATYSDYVLKLEAMLDYPIDSGLFLRVGEDGKSHQVTLDYRPDGDVGDVYLPWTQGQVHDSPEAGQGMALFRPGVWNDLEVRVEGEPARIQFFVNGHLVTDFQHTAETTRGVPREGAIGLQVHPGESWGEGNKVRFRNVRVKRL